MAKVATEVAIPSIPARTTDRLVASHVEDALIIEAITFFAAEIFSFLHAAINALWLLLCGRFELGSMTSAKVLWQSKVRTKERHHHDLLDIVSVTVTQDLLAKGVSSKR